MVQVYYSVDSNCKSEIVDGGMTLKQFCEGHGIATSRQIIVNSDVVTDCNVTLNSLADGSNIVDIVVSNKLQNA